MSDFINSYFAHLLHYQGSGTLDTFKNARPIGQYDIVSPFQSTQTASLDAQWLEKQKEFIRKSKGIPIIPDTANNFGKDWKAVYDAEHDAWFAQKKEQRQQEQRLEQIKQEQQMQAQWHSYASTRPMIVPVASITEKITAEELINDIKQMGITVMPAHDGVEMNMMSDRGMAIKNPLPSAHFDYDPTPDRTIYKDNLEESRAFEETLQKHEQKREVAKRRVI